MAGLNTELDPEFDTAVSLPKLPRQHYSTIAWLRWRIFSNSMRRKGATGELVAQILSYLLLAVMVFGPSMTAGFAGFYLVFRGRDNYLAVPLWIVFIAWQFIGANTSTSAPSFDLSTLTRFPIRYRDYFLIRLTFGLLDAPTLVGTGCLMGLTIGIGIAAPALIPWAALTLAIYAICNILFSRMIYSWLERWMAQRRSRELIAGLAVLFSVGLQIAIQFAQKRRSGSHVSITNLFAKTTTHVLLIVNNMLPPGLASSAIEHQHHGPVWLAIVALAGLSLYTAGFLLILHVRLHAQFLGENLSEVPAAAEAKLKSPRPGQAAAGHAARQAAKPGGLIAMLPSGVAACFIKEVHYLLRGGPKLYALIMPVFMVFLFSARSSAMSYVYSGNYDFRSFLFSSSCAYTQFLLVRMLYNSLAGDGTGVQFYFIAPVRMRDVLIAKNLLTAVVLVLETILTYIACTALHAHTPLSLTAATIAWVAFAFFVNASVGNLRSLTSPKGIDPSKLRGQNLSGVSGVISVVIIAISVLLGYLMVMACTYLQASYWMAAGAFLLLAAIAFAVYVVILQQADGIAAEHAEDLTQELCKA